MKRFLGCSIALASMAIQLQARGDGSQGAGDGGDSGGVADCADGSQHAAVVDPRRHSGAGTAVGLYRLGQPAVAAPYYA